MSAATFDNCGDGVAPWPVLLRSLRLDGNLIGPDGAGGAGRDGCSKCAEFPPAAFKDERCLWMSELTGFSELDILRSLLLRMSLNGEPTMLLGGDVPPERAKDNGGNGEFPGIGSDISSVLKFTPVFTFGWRA